MVHVRKIGDRTLSFIVSGKLWRNSLVMMDRETKSLWSHITGECLEGELVGSQLEQVSAVQTTWQEWHAAHPQTKVLKKEEEVHASRYQQYFDDAERVGILPITWQQDRLPGKALIHGVMLEGAKLAVADSAIPADGLQLKLAGIPLEFRRSQDGGVRALRQDSGDEVMVRLAYWFAWSAYFPETELFPATEPKSE